VAKIPKGKVLTYREVAARAGNPGAARVVGNLMKANFAPKIPCHRVIRSDGKPGDYNRGGSEKKRELLESEGACSCSTTNGILLCPTTKCRISGNKSQTSSFKESAINGTAVSVIALRTRHGKYFGISKSDTRCRIRRGGAKLNAPGLRRPARQDAGRLRWGDYRAA